VISLFSEVGTVLGREVLDAWRDRRTWIGSLLLPLLITPLIMSLMIWVVGVEGSDSKMPLVLIENPEHAPRIASFLQTVQGVTWLVNASDQKPHVRISFPPNFETALESGDSLPLVTKYDSSKSSSVAALAGVREIFHQLSIEIGRRNLQSNGLAPTLLPYIEVRTEDSADRIALGTLIMSVMLPMLLAMAASVGGLSTAIDTTAGEKERGTFEILLTTPLSRSSIALGKLLAVWLSAILSLLSTIFGIYVGILIQSLSSSASGTFEFHLPLVTGLLLLLNGSMLAGVFAGLQLAVCAMARSFKEAQTYVSPLAILPLLAAMGTMVVEPGNAPGYLYQIPVFSSILLTKDLLAQQVIAENVLLSLGITGLVAIAGCIMTSLMFQKESILFRT